MYVCMYVCTVCADGRLTPVPTHDKLEHSDQ
jgi:hypothetical protein